MKILLVIIFSCFVLGTSLAFAQKGVFVDKVDFIEYSNQQTALQEIKRGNLDIYFSNIPTGLIGDPKMREGLNVFQTNGGSLTLLVNPAKSDKFNPFSIREVRFALNYLVDRQLIVDEFLGGHGVQSISAYSQFDPDYLLVLDDLESFNFRYDPSLAEKMISDALVKSGAKKVGSKWFYDLKPIEVIIFIRTDDFVKRDIGESLAHQLEKIGFTVRKGYGDLNKAQNVVYGSDPWELKWNIYTEGVTPTAFQRYDSNNLADSYAPWSGYMPGFQTPQYWNYKNDSLDSITKRISYGNFTSANQRAELVKRAIHEGVSESVRIFLANRMDEYVSSDKVKGIINDFGAGVSNRFTPINARSTSDSLTIAVDKISQDGWNPIAGFVDKYSKQIWGAICDPGILNHPYTGLAIPIRSQWQVETAGPTGKLDVPTDAIKWDPSQQKWIQVGSGVKSISKVTFHLMFGNWHNGQPMDMNDVLYPIYFLYQWGADPTANSITFDSYYSPQKNQAAKTLIGIRVIDKNTIEVYEDYWHFDEDEIASYSDFWSAMPWELLYAMEKTVTGNKAAFSNTEAQTKEIPWLSLIIPDHAAMIRTSLEDFNKTKSVPPAIAQFESNPQYYESRYNASIAFILKHDHAIISNGPFYLERYLPEARMITIVAFDDPTYPFEQGHWKEFENVTSAKIQSVDMPIVVDMGKELTIPVSVDAGSILHYYFTDADGKIVINGTTKSATNKTEIKLTGEQTLLFGKGAINFKIFAFSESIPEPSFIQTSFLAVPESSYNETVPEFPIAIPVLLIGVLSVIMVPKMRFRK